MSYYTDVATNALAEIQQIQDLQHDRSIRDAYGLNEPLLADFYQHLYKKQDKQSKASYKQRVKEAILPSLKKGKKPPAFVIPRGMQADGYIPAIDRMEVTLEEPDAPIAPPPPKLSRKYPKV